MWWGGGQGVVGRQEGGGEVGEGEGVGRSDFESELTASLLKTQRKINVSSQTWKIAQSSHRRYT